MSLSSDDVAKIAHLARLAVEPADTESLSRDLSNILDLVEQMQAVDTEGVLPMAHPLEMSQRLRVDEVTEINQRELYQSNAPQAEGGFYGGDAANFPGSQPGHLTMPVTVFPGNSINIMTPAISYTGALDAGSAFNSLNLAYLRERIIYN